MASYYSSWVANGTSSVSEAYRTRLDLTFATGTSAQNYTDVTWSLYLENGNARFADFRTQGHVTINGVKVWDYPVTYTNASGSFNSSILLQAKDGTNKATGTLRVPHSSDGTKTIAFSTSFETITKNTVSAAKSVMTSSGSVVLETIPRASSFTLGGATQTNADVNVTIDRKSTAFTHSVRYKVDSGSWIAVTSSATTSASFKVQPSNMANLKSATITVGVQTYSGSTAIGTEATATRTITIPNTTITVSGTADTGSSQTVSITNSGGSLTFTRSWSLGGATGGDVASWTPPHSALPSAPASGTLTCTVVTKNGTATINTVSATRTITVPSTVLPTFTSITHAEYVSDVATKVGAYVQGKTRLTLGVTSPSAGSGSSIKSYSISVAGHTVSNGQTTPVINQSGTLTISATVTDNRNRTVTKTDTIIVLAYENPIVTGVSFTRSNSDGTPNSTGTYLTIKATIRVRQLVVGTTEKNLIWYQSESAQIGQSYTTKTNLTSQAGTVNGNYRESVYTHTFSGYPIDYPYNVRVRGGDIFSWSGYIAGGIPTGVVLQHWGENTTAFGKMIDSLDYNVLVGTKGLKSDGPIVAGGGGNVAPSTSAYNYSDGMLVDICPASLQNMVVVEVIGNGYGGDIPIHSIFQVYHYTPLGTLLSAKQTNMSGSLPAGKFLVDGGRLKLWFQQSSAYQTFIVRAYGMDGVPYKVSISNVTEPSATHKITCEVHSNSGSVSWVNVTGKPSTFEPSSHTHAWAQVTGPPAQATRWPTWSEVTSKPTTFAPSTHTHSVTRTTILATTAFALNGTYNISQSIQNFDLIIMYIGIYYVSASDNNAQVIAFSPASLAYGSVVSGGYNYGTNRQYGLFFPNATQIKCITAIGLVSPRVMIEGIKYTA